MTVHKLKQEKRGFVRCTKCGSSFASKSLADSIACSGSGYPVFLLVLSVTAIVILLGALLLVAIYVITSQ